MSTCHTTCDNCVELAMTNVLRIPLISFGILLALPFFVLAEEKVSDVLTNCHAATALPSPHCGVTPAPAFDLQGRLWVAFVQHGHVYVAHSQDLGATFSAPIAVNPVVEEIYTNGENRPKIAFGPQGEIYLSWTQKTAGRYTGNIRFSRSLDGGASFATPRTINDDGLRISHRFDSLAVTPSGQVYLVWLDKRDKHALEREHEEHNYSGAALYYAVSQDRGAHFTPNRKVADHSCECCRIAVAAYGDDGVAVFWRHIFDTNIRDHAFTVLHADTKPAVQRVTFDDWRIDACPHHGPAMSPAADGAYHLAWVTNGPEQKGIFYGHYETAGKKLSRKLSVDAAAGAGHPQVLADGRQTVLVWKKFDGNLTRLQSSMSADSGHTWSPVVTLLQTEDSSDHPALIGNGKWMYVFWHTEKEGCRLASVPTEGAAR